MQVAVTTWTHNNDAATIKIGDCCASLLTFQWHPRKPHESTTTMPAPTLTCRYWDDRAYATLKVRIVHQFFLSLLIAPSGEFAHILCHTNLPRRWPQPHDSDATQLHVKADYPQNFDEPCSNVPPSDSCCKLAALRPSKRPTVSNYKRSHQGVRDHCIE
jgi:hypothetical protein